MPLISSDQAARAILRRGSPVDELLFACLDNVSLFHFKCVCSEAAACCSEARLSTRWFDLRARSSTKKPIHMPDATLWRQNWPSCSAVIAEYAVFIVPETLKGVQRAVLRRWHEGTFDLFERIVPCIASTIRELHLYDVSNLDDSAFVPLAGTLEHLELHSCADTSDGCILGMRKLKRLSISNTDACEGVGLLTAGQALEQLTLLNVRPLLGWMDVAESFGRNGGVDGGAGSGAGAAGHRGGQPAAAGLFTHMHALTAIHVSYTDDSAPICWAHDAWVALPSSVSTVRLPTGARLQGRAAQFFGHVRHLELSAFYTTLTDTDFSHFVSLETLALLDARAEIGDGAFVALQASKRAVALAATSCAATAAAGSAPVLSHTPASLTALLLRGCDGITDDGLLSLDPTLRELHVQSTSRVGDAALAHHAGALRSLTLDTAEGGTCVTVQGLAACTQLHTLRLVRASDSEEDRAVLDSACFRPLQSLRYLSVEHPACCALKATDLVSLRGTLLWARLASNGLSSTSAKEGHKDVSSVDVDSLREAFEESNQSEWRFTVQPYSLMDVMIAQMPAYGPHVRLPGKADKWGTVIQRTGCFYPAYAPPVSMFASTPFNPLL